jgi:hypothetical protein
LGSFLNQRPLGSKMVRLFDQLSNGIPDVLSTPF